MSLEEEAAELLEKVADGFESGRYEWIKGMAVMRRSREEQPYGYCSVGALFYEAGLSWSTRQECRERDIYLRAEGQLAKTLGTFQQLFENGGSTTGIPLWNDDVASGVHEVIDTMKEAAKELRNQA